MKLLSCFRLLSKMLDLEKIQTLKYNNYLRCNSFDQFPSLSLSRHLTHSPRISKNVPPHHSTPLLLFKELEALTQFSRFNEDPFHPFAQLKHPQLDPNTTIGVIHSGVKGFLDFFWEGFAVGISSSQFGEAER